MPFPFRNPVLIGIADQQIFLIALSPFTHRQLVIAELTLRVVNAHADLAAAKYASKYFEQCQR